jgi:hypothetical protein
MKRQQRRDVVGHSRMWYQHELRYGRLKAQSNINASICVNSRIDRFVIWCRLTVSGDLS